MCKQFSLVFCLFFPRFLLFSFPLLKWSNGQHFCLTQSPYPGLVPKPEGEEMAFFLGNFALTVFQSYTTLTCLFLTLLWSVFELQLLRRARVWLHTHFASLGEARWEIPSWQFPEFQSGRPWGVRALNPTDTYKWALSHGAGCAKRGGKGQGGIRGGGRRKGTIYHPKWAGEHGETGRSSWGT